jgi:uncharacterized protein (DUF433 family)
MILTDRIELNPRICNGGPVIKGTRIPVSVILEQIAAGESWDVLLVGYPELTKEDIQAALLYARSSLDHTEVRAAYTTQPPATLKTQSMPRKHCDCRVSALTIDFLHPKKPLASFAPLRFPVSV